MKVSVGINLRPAKVEDIDSIVELVNGYAAEAIMLFRSYDSVMLSLRDFVVAADSSGKILACGSLKEYSPSVAEVASVAVARNSHGLGLGRLIVEAVEQLAHKRGIYDLFAFTTTPQFFEKAGYAVVDRSAYPEKIRRDCMTCPRRIRCAEYCVSRLAAQQLPMAA